MEKFIDKLGRKLPDERNGQFAHLAAAVAVILSSCATGAGSVVALRGSAAEEMAERRGQEAESVDILKRQRMEVALTALRDRIKDDDLRKIPMDKLIKEAMGNFECDGRAEYNINNVTVVVRYFGTLSGCNSASPKPKNKAKVPDHPNNLQIVFFFEFNGKIYEFHFNRFLNASARRIKNIFANSYSHQVFELYPGIDNEFGNTLAYGFLDLPEDYICDHCLEECIIQQCRDAADQITCKEGCIQKARDERPAKKFRDKMPDDLRWLYEYCRGVLARAF